MTDDETAEMVGWYLGAEPQPCSHQMHHTVYEASDPARNVTSCVICGKRLGEKP